MQNDNFVLYKISNPLEGKAYIGITSKTLALRWKHHIAVSRTGKGGALGAAIRGNGPSVFVVEQIASAFSADDMRHLEKVLISQERTHKSLGGYNLTAGGQGSYGFRHSPQSIERIRAVKKELYESRREETGSAVNQATRDKLSAFQKGRPKSHGTRQLMSIAATGKTPTDETREKIRLSKVGLKASDEAKQKMSVARKGKKRPGLGAKMSAILKGVPKTDAHKAALSKSHRNRWAAKKAQTGDLQCSAF